MSNAAEVINLFEQENDENSYSTQGKEQAVVKADLDNGYTRIANTLIEALASNPAKLSGREYQVFAAVILKTYRYHKKEDWIAQSQLVEITGISKTHISDLVKSLIGKKVLIKSRKTIAINTVISQWVKFPNLGTKVPEFGNESSLIKEQKFPDSGATIRKKLLHKNNNNICSQNLVVSDEKPKPPKPIRVKKPESFKNFYATYPAHRKGGTDAQAWKAWKSEKLTEQDGIDALAWLKKAAQQDPQWQPNANGQFVLGITKFIREKRWKAPLPTKFVTNNQPQTLDMDDTSWANNLDEVY